MVSLDVESKENTRTAGLGAEAPQPQEAPVLGTRQMAARHPWVPGPQGWSCCLTPPRRGEGSPTLTLQEAEWSLSPGHMDTQTQGHRGEALATPSRCPAPIHSATGADVWDQSVPGPCSWRTWASSCHFQPLVVVAPGSQLHHPSFHFTLIPRGLERGRLCHEDSQG